MKIKILLAGLYLSLFAGTVQAAENAGVPSPEALDSTKLINEVKKADVSVWVDNASLGFVVDQLAHMSGRQSIVEGSLDGRVSGRFSGSMGATLSALATTYPVLFDVDSEALHAVSAESRSSVSIALAKPELVRDYQAGLMEGLLPGNTIEFGDDAVRVSGHPAFVDRTAKSITASLADASAAAASLSDAGSKALLQDIQEESQPVSERAQLSKPICWVTDIPGYTTF